MTRTYSHATKYKCYTQVSVNVLTVLGILYPSTCPAAVDVDCHHKEIDSHASNPDLQSMNFLDLLLAIFATSPHLSMLQDK